MFILWLAGVAWCTYRYFFVRLGVGGAACAGWEFGLIFYGDTSDKCYRVFLFKLSQEFMKRMSDGW